MASSACVHRAAPRAAHLPRACARAALRWNVTEVSRLGVKCVYTPRGLTAAAWREGLALFSGGGGGGGASKQQQKQKQAGRAHQ